METLLALLPHEEWRDVVGWEGFYLISNLGNVKSVSRIVKFKNGFQKTMPQTLLQPFKSIRGYKMVLFSVNKQRKHRSLQRLVAEAFISNPKNKPQVNHINGIKTDNCFFNLEWVTESENKTHAHRTGLCPSGENHRDAKLSNAQVREIRILYESGLYKKIELAKMYGENPLLISRVTRYKTYKYVI